MSVVMFMLGMLVGVIGIVVVSAVVIHKSISDDFEGSEQNEQ